ncbi:MAG TPA: hypothetical protein VG456_21605 [Candidatus Sulfopaludibacter sp.]|nr:hypothetical protein [Candidatus Sulfopaludibacter sp.]
MVPLLILAALVSIPYALYRAVRKWGMPFLYLTAAAVAFLGCTGVLAESLWGPEWSWNFAHHNRAYAWSALFQAIVFLVLGLIARNSRRPSTSETPRTP